jgi:hypothetical protein
MELIRTLRATWEQIITTETQNLTIRVALARETIRYYVTMISVRIQFHVNSVEINTPNRSMYNYTHVLLYVLQNERQMEELEFATQNQC